MNEMHLRNAWSCNIARKPSSIWILAIRCIVLHTNLAFSVRARWAYFLETLLYFEKIQYATRDLPSVACQITRDRFNCGRQIFFFDEPYRKIVRVLKTGAGRNLLCLQTISKRLCRVVSELKGRMGGWGVWGLEKVIHIRKRGYCRRAGNGSREEWIPKHSRGWLKNGLAFVKLE